MVCTNALPWSYVPAQLFGRLPEAFLLLLGVGLLSGVASALAILRLASGPQSGLQKLQEALMVTAQARQRLIVWAAAIYDYGICSSLTAGAGDRPEWPASSADTVALASAIERASVVSSSCCVRNFKWRFKSTMRLMQTHR
jgi:hypothetical protein